GERKWGGGAGGACIGLGRPSGGASGGSARGLERGRSPTRGGEEEPGIDRVAEAAADGRQPGYLVGAVGGVDAVGDGPVVADIGSLQIGLNAEHVVAPLPVVSELSAEERAGEFRAPGRDAQRPRPAGCAQTPAL